MSMSVLPSAVLFACTMNAIRSPMAEGIMKHYHGKRVYVQSCGVHAGSPDAMAYEVMQEIGIDITHHRSRTFEELDDDFFDLVISMSPNAQHKAVDMTRTMSCDIKFWNTFDPSYVEGNRATRLDAYRQVRDELKTRILDIFPLIEDAAE